MNRKDNKKKTLIWVLCGVCIVLLCVFVILAITGQNNSKEPVDTISFSIDGVEYNAEPGMTWGEWVDSDYNSAGFFPHPRKDALAKVYINRNDKSYGITQAQEGKDHDGKTYTKYRPIRISEEIISEENYQFGKGRFPLNG